jgi:hypothetical protein
MATLVALTCRQTFRALSQLACHDDPAAIDALNKAKLTFANGGAPMPKHGRAARMSELAFATAPAGGPLLLENRIHVLRLAAEIYSLGGRKSLDAELRAGVALRANCRSHD